MSPLQFLTILMSVFILSVFSCTVLFVSISEVIGCEDRLRNDLYCVEWGVKLYLNQPTNHLFFAVMALLARALVDIFVHIFLPVILWQ